MAAGATAKTYALVLRDIGKAKGLLDSFAEELSSFNEILRTDKEFGVFLALPSVGSEAKKSFIQKVFSSRITNEFLDFLCVLIDNGRHNEIAEIETVFSRLLDEEKNSIRVSMITGVPLDSVVREKAVSMLAKKFGKNVILEEEVDPAIIGGIVIRAGDTVIDGSVTTRIRAMKEKLLLSTIKGDSLYEDKD